MNSSDTRLLERSLAEPDIHRQWESVYRTVENELFFDQAFDYIARTLDAPEQSVLLDAGCGTCAHAIRLANRGFFVQAVDFSPSVLETAREYVRTRGLESRIKIRCEDILEFSFGDETFDFVLCWGVLMHIPDLEKAISELARILKPGGMIVISEGNMHSLQSVVLRGFSRFRGAKKTIVKKTPAGLEFWKTDSNGTLLTRQVNIRWLIDRFEGYHLMVRKRVAGEFSEAYTKVPVKSIRRFIHGFNTFWFKYVKIPQLASGNIIIFEKAL